MTVSYQMVDVTLPNTSITLVQPTDVTSATAITGTTIAVGVGDDIVWGLGGSTTINLDAGNHTVGLTGQGNQITPGAGTNTVSAGNDGNTTMTVGGGDNDIDAGGSGDSVRLLMSARINDGLEV
jgi:hypothetical protein